MIFTEITEDEYDEFGFRKIFREGLDKHPDMPQIGDIIEGSVSSVQPYGFFIKLVEKRERRRQYWISGLLHKSNIKKNHLFSISNPELKERSLDPLKRKITVEVIDFTDKGYALKEVLPKLILNVEEISKANCKTMMYSVVENILVSIEEDAKITLRKPIKTISLQKCKNTIIYNNEIYYKLETDSPRKNFYLSKNYKAITGSYIAMEFIVLHNEAHSLPYNYFNPTVKLEDWWENQSIDKYNKDVYNKYYAKIKMKKNQEKFWEEEKKKKDSFIKEVEKNPPTKIFNMYMSTSFSIKYGRKMRDKDHVSRNEYSEETSKDIIKVEVFEYHNNEYFKIDGSWEKTIENHPSMGFISNTNFSWDNKTLIVSSSSSYSTEKNHYMFYNSQRLSFLIYIHLKYPFKNYCNLYGHLNS